MSSPKKKLPTGPIRINPPVTHQVETSAAQTQARVLSHNPEEEPEPSMKSIKQDSAFIDSNMPDSSSIDSVFLESVMEEVSTLDSSSQVSGLPQATREESDKEESTQMDDPPQAGSSESGFPESGLTETEYKKVAMRLSLEAVESLRQLRATTGVPYEILVDVMIRNWDKLPQRTKAAYLQEAKQVRASRLIAGQEKTMKTMRTKYLAQ